MKPTAPTSTSRGLENLPTKMKKFTILFVLVLGFSACKPDSNNPILNRADYAAYMEAKPQAVNQSHASEEIKFWNQRLEDHPESKQNMMQLAGAYSQRFREDGNIDHIHTSDELFKKSLNTALLDKAGIYRALTANAITRHSFKEAYALIHEAIKIGSDQAANHLLLFDVAMELGFYNEAQRALELQQQKSHFNYLIRASKWADHQGDLDRAIDLMEQAFLKKKNDPMLYQWAKSNLGDMYGHAGRVEDAYAAYLEVLAVNPEHWRSWQGLAWIAYAHDGDLEEAQRIINYMSGQSQDIQSFLLKADLASSKGMIEDALRLKSEFYQEASKPKYGQMYNKHLALIEAEDLNEPAKAIERLNNELKLRETPEIYDVLAWAKLLNGAPEEALIIAESQVKGKTFEPDALYHMGMIYMANGRKKEAQKLLKEALEAAFELGPITTSEIRQTLAD